MAWNEPGGGNNNNWGNGGGNRGGDQGPPDLDEVLKKMQDKLGGLFNGNNGGNGADGGSDGQGPGNGKAMGVGVGVLIAIAAILWMLSGIYIVQPAERGVVMRFGEYVETTTEGPHWHLPYPIETVEKVDVDRIRSLSHKASMLTQDENIIEIDMAVQYRVSSAADYLFQTRNPDATLKQALETSVREAIGKAKMDFILTEGRSEIVTQSEELMQEIVDNYKTGLIITSVNLQDAQPPEQVQDAFADAIKAREDEQRVKNEAEAYARDIIPKARGEAERRLQEAEAYKSQVVAQSEGEASRFTQLLTEYSKAPDVTRERLYLQTVEQVLTATSKVMVDVEGGNSLMYLPVDKLMEGRGGNARPGNQSDTVSTPLQRVVPTQIDNTRLRTDLRRREIR